MKVLKINSTVQYLKKPYTNGKTKRLVKVKIVLDQESPLSIMQQDKLSSFLENL